MVSLITDPRVRDRPGLRLAEPRPGGLPRLLLTASRKQVPLAEPRRTGSGALLWPAGRGLCRALCALQAFRRLPTHRLMWRSRRRPVFIRKSPKSDQCVLFISVKDCVRSLLVCPVSVVISRPTSAVMAEAARTPPSRCAVVAPPVTDPRYVA